MGERYAVVLAAGQGTRMKSKLYKVLHPVAGRPMVQHVIDQLKPLHLEDIVTIVGFGAEKVVKQLGEASNFVTQEEQLGTGHAVQQAEELLSEKRGTTIVVCGDTPLLTEETFAQLFAHHEEQQSKATILTAEAPNPTGYGRVIRNENNDVERIVEQKDANDEELLVHEINTGTYCFDNELLFEALKKVSNENAQGEYYLPDVIEILKDEGHRVSAYICEDFDETLGVNDRVALSQAETIMRKRLNEKHMRNGVTIIDPLNTYIDASVEIAQDVTLHPGTILTGDTKIATECIIGPQVELQNCHVGERTTIKNSVILDSVIRDDVVVGPYAHIRPGSDVGNEAKIGHFVELKKTVVGEGSKIPHLSYVGDAQIGNKVNIGCGTITVNYDGQNKHETKIADESFIGSNSNLIAPISIGKSAYVAAGSTITKDVPEGALSIGRTKQTNREGYAAKIKAQQKNDGGF